MASSTRLQYFTKPRRNLLGLLDWPKAMRLPGNGDRLVTVFASRSHLANVEAEVIQSLLESAGIACWLARENVIQQPVGNLMVKVLESHAEEARELLRDAVRGADGA